MGSKISANQSSLTQYSERFYISDHPLYSNQNIKLLHEKLTSNIFVLSILSACDLRTKQEYHKLINQKLALKAATITQIQHYFQQVNSNACSQFYKIYVLFAIKQMITLKQYILTLKLGKKGYNYKKLDQGINYLLLAVSYLKYLNQPHKNINTSTILIDDQKFLLSDPWISPLQHSQNYPSPQKLSKINNNSQNFDQYANDVFAIGMTFLQVLSQSNVKSVYKKNNKIDMNQLKQLFDSVQKINQNKLLNPQNLYISSLMGKLKIILFQNEKQRLKMLQTFNKLNQQRTQKFQYKGIKKTINKLRNISESQIKAQITQTNKISHQNNNNFQLFRKKPFIDTVLLNNFEKQNKIYGEKQNKIYGEKQNKIYGEKQKEIEIPINYQIQNIRLQKVNLRKPNKQIKIYQQDCQNNQFYKNRDSQATVKITKQYEKPQLKNNQLKSVNSLQNNLKGQNQRVWNTFNKFQSNNQSNKIYQSYNKSSYLVDSEKNIYDKKDFKYQSSYQPISKGAAKVNFVFNNPNSFVEGSFNKYNLNLQKHIQVLTKKYQTLPHFSTFPFQKQNYYKDNNENKFNKYTSNKQQTSNINLQINKIPNQRKIQSKDQSDYYKLKNQSDYFRLNSINFLQNFKDQPHNNPYLTSYLQSRYLANSQVSNFFQRQVPFIEKSQFKSNNNAYNHQLTKSNEKNHDKQEILTLKLDEKFKNQLEKLPQNGLNNKLSLANTNNTQFSNDYHMRFSNHKNIQFKDKILNQTGKQNPAAKKSVWKKTLQQSLNLSNFQVQGIQTTKSIIEPFKLSSYQNSSNYQQYNTKVSRFSKKYPQQIQYNEIINQQNETQEQKTNKKIEFDEQKNQEQSKMDDQNSYSNKRLTSIFSQFQQKNSLQIPQVERRIINLKNQNYHIQESTNQANRIKQLSQTFADRIKIELSPESILSVENSSTKSKIGQQISSLNYKLQSIQNKFSQAIDMAANNFNNCPKSQGEYYSLSKFQSSQKKYNDTSMVNQNKIKDKDQIILDEDQASKILYEYQRNSSNKAQSIKSQNITEIWKLKSNDQDQIKQENLIQNLCKKGTKSQKDKMQETQTILQLTKSEKFISLQQQSSFQQKQNKIYNQLQNKLIKQNNFQFNQNNQQTQKCQPIKSPAQPEKSSQINFKQTTQKNQNNSLNNVASYEKISSIKLQQTYYTPNKLEYSSFPQLISRTIPQEQQEGSLNGSFLNQNIQPFGDYVQQQYQNGGKYYGYMHNSMRNGPGKFYYRDGGYYDGVWKNNMMNGYGKLYYDNGKLAYEGQWYKDQFHGRGKVYNDSAEQLLTSFDYRNFQNIEQYWEFYQGQLSHDTKVGYGKIKLSNGQIFSGTFVNDKAHGLGRFLTLEGDVVKGIWHDGKLIKQISRERKSHFEQNEQQQGNQSASKLNQQIRIQEFY